MTDSDKHLLLTIRFIENKIDPTRTPKPDGWVDLFKGWDSPANRRALRIEAERMGVETWL